MNKDDWKQYFTPHRIMLVVIIILLIYLFVYYTIKYNNIKNIIPYERDVKNNKTIL